MTVIKGNKTYFNKPGSAAASDTESLHLGSASASDAESIHNEPTTSSRLFRALPIRPLVLEDPVHLKKSSGKKKLRRYQNRCILQTLTEEDECENTVVIIMEPYTSPFARLLNDSKAMEFWNNFVEKSEKEQTDIINAFSEKCHDKPGNKYKQIDSSVGWISSRVKRTFKTKKNISLETIKYCEYDMLDFFNVSPDDTYVKSPPTSFDRLLIKAIAHYHGLQIKNIGSSQPNEKPSVEIFNKRENWVPAKCFLTDFIQQLR